jgi:RNA recognition motif-containing protein
MYGCSSPLLLHFALASVASAYCSDDLAIVCTISHKEPSVNIYVGNLAFTTTDHDLRQLFEPYGVVDEIRVITDRDTGRSKGFGFVEMPDSTTAKTAIAGLQGKELAGRTLTVNEAKPREPRREPSRSRW